MSEEIKTEEAGTDNNQEEKKQKKSIVTSFMDGAKEGFYIGIENMITGYGIGLRYNQVPGTYGPRKSDWKGICSGNGNFWPAGRGGNCVNVGVFCKSGGSGYGGEFICGRNN